MSHFPAAICMLLVRNYANLSSVWLQDCLIDFSTVDLMHMLEHSELIAVTVPLLFLWVLKQGSLEKNLLVDSSKGVY